MSRKRKYNYVNENSGRSVGDMICCRCRTQLTREDAYKYSQNGEGEFVGITCKDCCKNDPMWTTLQIENEAYAARQKLFYDTVEKCIDRLVSLGYSRDEVEGRLMEYLDKSDF